MAGNMGHARVSVKGRKSAAFSTQTSPPARLGLIIINLFDLPLRGFLRNDRCTMRFPPALLACVLVVIATAASAESRVFIIANESDGYGVDQCLAKGDKCGAYAARSYCQSRDFAQASSYRRIDPDEITGSVPKPAATCARGGCSDYVAITCQR
ncbi:MAG: hypothetical protein V7634_4614 [Bradyrhizobium sp.]|jgi:hypothetical protein